MIEYDYVIKRDEKDEIVPYKPDKIPRKLSDVTYIEGPNSIGKSTLLNLIALAFFGHKMDDEIESSLLWDIRDLLEKDHQDLKFVVKIENESSSVVLKSKKNDFNNNDIVVTEIADGRSRPISFENFKKKYKLIYDIPIDPTQRISQILKDLRLELTNKGNKLKNLENLARRVSNEISKAKDPEHEDELRKEIAEFEEQKEKKSKVLENKKEYYKKAQKYLYSKFYDEYKGKFEKHSKNRKKIENELDRKSTRESALDEDLRFLVDSKRDTIKHIKQLREDAVGLIREVFSDKLENRIKLFLDRKINEEVKNYQSINNFRGDLNWFRQKINQYLDDILDNEDYQEAKFIQHLIGFLKKFKETKIQIPKLEHSVKDYLEVLEDRLEKFRSVLREKKKLENVLELITGMDDDISSAINDQKDIERKTEEDEKLQEDLEDESDFYELEMSEKLEKDAEKKKKYFRKKLVQTGVDPDNYKDTLNNLSGEDDLEEVIDLSESRLNIYLDGLDEEITELEEVLENIEKGLELDREELEEIENQEPHKLRNYAQELENLQGTLYELSKKIEQRYKGYIDKMIKGKKPSSGEEDYIRFAEITSNYLATKIQSVTYIEKKYNLKKIDLLNRKLITKSGKEIQLSDMGTGQGQSAYIDGVLSMNDERKVIALFDEVGMMDKNSLQPIKDRLKALHEENKLLAGLIVQRGDEVKVKSLV